MPLDVPTTILLVLESAILLAVTILIVVRRTLQERTVPVLLVFTVLSLIWALAQVSALLGWLFLSLWRRSISPLRQDRICRWRRLDRPVHFFGAIGLVCGALGTLILAYLAAIKFLQGQDIGSRPLLLAGIVLILASLQFITTGIATEMMARTYFESAQTRSYLTRETDADHATSDDPWHEPAVR